MTELAFFLLLLLGVAAGFWLGRRSLASGERRARSDYTLNYYKGLSYLFNEQPDSAIDAFIDSLEVNSDTLETHLALGNMLRRRGEVTKAIKIHQNLLARPVLSGLQQHEAQLELARDYVKAGLLDRAEALLSELVDISPHYKPAALEHLIEIYQDEKEWGSAIATAKKLDTRHNRPSSGQPLNHLQAHFACELAQEMLEEHNPERAREHLESALAFDPKAARASLLLAQLDHSQGAYRQAIGHLHKIPQQAPELIVEALNLLCDCYDKIDEPQALHSYLSDLLEHHPSNSLVIKIAERLRWGQGDYAAGNFIAEQLKQRPSIRTLNRLVELYLPHSEGKAKENLELLKQLVDQVIGEQPSYRCHQCGFTGNELHWLCPGCKTWGSVHPIRGVAGE